VQASYMRWCLTTVYIPYGLGILLNLEVSINNLIIFYYLPFFALDTNNNLYLSIFSALNISKTISNSMQ